MKSKRIFDNSKVESHSAIIPTYLQPKQLSADEAKVYQAIKNRFIMQFMPVAEYEETRIETKIHDADLKGLFITKGKVQLVEGWKKVEKIQSKDILLPFVQVNDQADLIKHEILSQVTKPPSRQNQ